jgi:hypothetical protein
MIESVGHVVVKMKEEQEENSPDYICKKARKTEDQGRAPGLYCTCWRGQYLTQEEGCQ